MMARPEVSRSDAMAIRLLEAALSLVDEGLGDVSDLDPAKWARRQNSTLAPLFARLTARAVCQRAGTTYTTAITSRWQDIQTFVHDVLRRGLATAHSDGTTWHQLAELSSQRIADAIAAGMTPPEACVPAVDDLLSFVMSSPRAMLPAHIAPYLPNLGALGLELSEQLRKSQLQWGSGVSAAVESAGFRFRPGWSAQIVVDCAQALLDGWLVRRWTTPDLVPLRPLGDPTPSQFAAAIEAMAIGALEPVDRWL
jgi:hypothetical protein